MYVSDAEIVTGVGWKLLNRQNSWISYVLWKRMIIFGYSQLAKSV